MDNEPRRKAKRQVIDLMQAGHSCIGTQSDFLMSLQSVILDALRAYSRPKEVPLPESGNPEEPFGEDTHEGHEVWDAILPLLPDRRDQRVAYLLFHCGLKPREILRFCPLDKNGQKSYCPRSTCP